MIGNNPKLSDMPTDLKRAYLTDINLRESDLTDSLRDQIRDVLASDTDDAARSMAVNLLGDHIDDPSARSLLEQHYAGASEDCYAGQIILSFLTVSLFDESEDVRAWGIRLIRKHHGIDPDNRDQLGKFMAGNMENELYGLHLRWHSILGLAYLGTRFAADRLIAFGNVLALRIPVVSRSDSSDQDINRFLAEKIAYAVGLCADTIAENGIRDNAARLLKRLQERLTDRNKPQEAGQHPAAWALDRLSVGHKDTKRSVIPKRGIIALAACLACVVVLYGIYDRFRSPKIEAFGVFRLTAADTMRNPVKPVSPADLLQHGDVLTVRFQTDKPAHVCVLLHDTGDLMVLFSGQTPAKTPKTIPDDNSRILKVPPGPGTASIFGLVSKTPISRSDDRLAQLKQQAAHQPITIEDIRRLFPEADVIGQSFRYE